MNKNPGARFFFISFQQKEKQITIFNSIDSLCLKKYFGACAFAAISNCVSSHLDWISICIQQITPTKVLNSIRLLEDESLVCASYDQLIWLFWNLKTLIFQTKISDTWTIVVGFISIIHTLLLVLLSSYVFQLCVGFYSLGLNNSERERDRERE